MIKEQCPRLPVGRHPDSNSKPQGIAFRAGHDDASRPSGLREAVANAAIGGKAGGAAARGEDIGARAEPPAEVALEA